MDGQAGTLDTHSPIPLYHQLRTAMLEKIERGDWSPGNAIPTESELMNMYGVSRTTVREAVSALVREGYLEKQQGRGTFVHRPSLVERLGKLTGFAEEMRRQGLVPSARVLGVYEQQEHPLGWADSAPWTRIVRLRLASGHPVALETSHWPQEAAALFRAVDLRTAAFYDILEQHGVHLKHADEDISAVNAARDESPLLGVPVGAALLKMTRCAYGPHDQLLEFTTTVYRGDAYTYHLQLVR